jgi:hypothetical protein
MQDQKFVATLYHEPELKGDLEPFLHRELKGADEVAAHQEARDWVRDRPKSPYKYVRLIVRRDGHETLNVPINDLTA